VTITNGLHTTTLDDLSGMNEIWVSGGGSGYVLGAAGVLVDEIFWIPEPTALGLLALGGLAALRRRR
jgi:hypothetical protein